MPTGYPFCYSEGTCGQTELVILIIISIMIVFSIIALITWWQEKHRKGQGRAQEKNDFSYLDTMFHCKKATIYFKKGVFDPI
jgi:hypothetical protein